MSTITDGWIHRFSVEKINKWIDGQKDIRI